jgi:hypothetical protein
VAAVDGWWRHGQLACCSMAVRTSRARLGLLMQSTGLLCPCCDICSSTVKVVELVPSRAAVVQLPPSMLSHVLYLGLTVVTTARRRGWLQDSGGVC